MNKKTPEQTVAQMAQNMVDLAASPAVVNANIGEWLVEQLRESPQVSRDDFVAHFQGIIDTATDTGNISQALAVKTAEMALMLLSPDPDA